LLVPANGVFAMLAGKVRSIAISRQAKFVGSFAVFAQGKQINAGL